MSEPRFPPMPTFMGKPLDGEKIATDAARVMIAEASRLQKEVDRLRDALREIATYSDPYSGTDEDLRAMQRIAEDALEPSSNGDNR